MKKFAFITFIFLTLIFVSCESGKKNKVDDNTGGNDTNNITDFYQ